MRLLRRLHRWIGLALALPMIAQAVSGCILAATPLVERLTMPAITPDTRPPDDVATIVAVARAAAPGQEVRRYRIEPGGAAVVSLAAPRTQAVTSEVVVDPILGRVLETRVPGHFYSWVHLLHEHLLLPEFGGRSLIGWFGVGLLFLGLSGIPLWWPQPGRWREAVTISPRARGLRLQRQMHGAAGIWIVAMLLVQSVSGVALAFPQTARAMFGLPQQQRQGGPRPQTAADSVPDFSALASAAQGAVPDGVLTDLRLPPGRPAMAMMRSADQWPGAPATMVMLSADNRVLSVQDPRRQGAGSILLAWLRALHFGEGFGLPWRLAVIAGGLGLAVLPVTGVAMWLLRRQRRSRATRQRQALQGAGE